jgi:hypothetical protein
VGIGLVVTPDFGVWIEGKQGSKGGTFLAHGPEGIMREAFGNIIRKIPLKFFRSFVCIDNNRFFYKILKFNFSV